MIPIPRSVRIFIGSTPIDMRKSIDGLMTIVQEELEHDAYSGHLFVFVSRRCDRVKILTWDKGSPARRSEPCPPRGERYDGVRSRHLEKGRDDMVDLIIGRRERLDRGANGRASRRRHELLN